MSEGKMPCWKLLTWYYKAVIRNKKGDSNGHKEKGCQENGKEEVINLQIVIQNPL
jgi:hypothetical protein